VTVRILPSRRVICSRTLEFPIPAGAVWGQMRDFYSTARHDPFHAHIQIDGHRPRAGAELLIEHRYLLARIVRHGRILRWQEGTGFAFSDLSRSDSARGFPHVVSYRLEAVDPGNCRLHIRVTGRWTFPGPRWIGRLWLMWVFTHVAGRVENGLMQYVLVMQRKRARGAED
jgi:hypothetical protein